MKNFEELSESNGKPYVINNQAVEFALGYNPSLSLKIKRAYLIDGKFFGLISIGNIFHMVTERNAFYVGISYTVACEKLDEYMSEQLDPSLTSWLKGHLETLFRQKLSF